MIARFDVDRCIRLRSPPSGGVADARGGGNGARAGAEQGDGESAAGGAQDGGVDRPAAAAVTHRRTRRGARPRHRQVRGGRDRPGEGGGRHGERRSDGRTRPQPMSSVRCGSTGHRQVVSLSLVVFWSPAIVHLN